MSRLQAYITGFALSIVLTMTSYLLVSKHVHSHHLTFSDNILIGIVIFLALVQFFVQLVFFLHLGAEPKPKWNLITFGAMATVVLILVAGSLWIMYNLNYHHPLNQTDQSIINDEGFGHQH